MQNEDGDSSGWEDIDPQSPVDAPISPVGPPISDDSDLFAADVPPLDPLPPVLDVVEPDEPIKSLPDVLNEHMPPFIIMAYHRPEDLKVSTIVAFNHLDSWRRGVIRRREAHPDFDWGVRYINFGEMRTRFNHDLYVDTLAGATDAAVSSWCVISKPRSNASPQRKRNKRRRRA